MDFEKNSGILKALGHPIRLAIVEGLLDNNECNVNKIVGKLKIPQSTASQHLAILKSKGILSYRKKGVEVCYFVSNEKVKNILKSIQE
jgi:ArsR family transcriptional regulator